MVILGVSCYYHDSAAAILKDGELVAAAAEERFSRQKHDSGFPHNAIEFCLNSAGITTADLDFAVFYEKPLLKFERILLSSLQMFPQSSGVFRESMITWFNEKLWIKSQLLDKLQIPASKLLFAEHHMSHAASAFFTAPYDEAAIMTIDGVGEWTTATVGYGKSAWDASGENSIDLFSEVRFPHSIGLLYSAFTAYLGFRVNNGEYKVMGMAPFGEPNYLDKVHQLIRLGDDGSFNLDMDYFSYHYSPRRTFNRKFVKLFGDPRPPEREFFTAQTHPDRAGSIADENQRFADIAASIQAATEEAIINMANYAHRQTGSRRLVMAGGVALNSVANGKILEQTPFEELYIHPEAGDGGGALGAALYAYHILLNKPRKLVMDDHVFYGKGYTTAEIRAVLDEQGVKYEMINDEAKLTARTVDTLLDGGVVGWYHGRFEWGPRALGNRSILADPRRPEMKETVNVKIKFREPFRPFAPVVTEERAPDYFDMGPYDGQATPRFMLVVRPIPEDKQSDIPAVTHVNGGGRLQAVRRQDNQRYYDVIKGFGEATGVPVLLNTSFNLRGEPIVTSPANALNTFSKSGINTMYMGKFIIRK